MRLLAIVGPAALVVAGGAAALAGAPAVISALLVTTGAGLGAFVTVRLTRELERRSAEQAATKAQMRESATTADQARVALTAERRFLRQIIDINPNFVFAKDRQGRFTLVNQAVADVYGTSIDGLVGKA